MKREATTNDVLVPDPVVAKEFAISLMTLSRWTNDHALGFPPAVSIRNRNYRSRVALEKFKADKLREAIRQRGAA